MTAQLSRERLEEIAEDGFVAHGEVKVMARMLLAVMDSEPLAMQNFRAAMEGIGHIRRTLDETFGGLHGTHCEPDVLVECKVICDSICEAYRRTAPTAPVAVPTFEEWCQRKEQKPVGWVREAMKEAYDGCRAAMLKAEPVTAATVPDSLKQAVAFYEQVKQENTPVENGAWKDAVDWVLKEACRAAAPAAPEQEV